MVQRALPRGTIEPKKTGRSKQAGFPWSMVPYGTMLVPQFMNLCSVRMPYKLSTTLLVCYSNKPESFLLWQERLQTDPDKEQCGDVRSTTVNAETEGKPPFCATLAWNRPCLHYICVGFSNTTHHRGHIYLHHHRRWRGKFCDPVPPNVLHSVKWSRGAVTDCVI